MNKSFGLLKSNPKGIYIFSKKDLLGISLNNKLAINVVIITPIGSE